MISLEQDIRESDDDLDTILKRHNTNLYEIFNKEPKNKIVEKEHTYEQFKDFYYNRLDLRTSDVQRILGINTHKWMKYLKRAIKETGLKRQGGRSNKIVFAEPYKEDTYQEFKKHYLNGMTCVNIKSYLGIHGELYGEFIRRVYEETGYKRKRGRRKK